MNYSALLSALSIETPVRNHQEVRTCLPMYKQKDLYNEIFLEIKTNNRDYPYNLFQYEAEIKEDKYSQIRTRLDRTILDSEYIASLSDNWDDEGSKGFSRAHWAHATSILRSIYRKLTDNNEILTQIGNPIISPAANGCIDISWTTKNIDILIAVYEDNYVSFDIFEKAKRIHHSGCFSVDSFVSALKITG